MATPLPRQRSFVILGIIGLALVLLSYVVILLIAAACAYLPVWLLLNVSSGGFPVLALALCGIAMAGAMVWSLMPRRDKFEEPGPQIDRSSQPRLFAELDEIAAALNQPVPKHVFLIAQLNAFVNDRGGIMGFGSRRIMAIGLPLVSVLNVDEFRAVLAHEFAHYYSGDTRLGPIVYRTRLTMIRTIQNMASLNVVMRVALAQIAYRLVMWILQGYWKLYFRATQIIFRRQEYRADELACHIVSSQSLIDGLKKIHAGSAAFPPYWNSEIAGFLNQGFRPAITEGFELFIKVPQVAKQIEALIETELKEGKSDPYDSHPSLRSRIAAAQRFTSQEKRAECTMPARTLFHDILQEEARLLAHRSPEANVKNLKVIAWEDMSRLLPAMWAASLRAHAHLLADMTPEHVPDAVLRLSEIGSRIPDSKGMLLTPEQRSQRAFDLIGTALALAVARAGWPLHMSPGEHYFDVNGEHVGVRESLERLAAKKMTAEEWITRCETLRIKGVRLGAEPASAAGDRA